MKSIYFLTISIVLLTNSIPSNAQSEEYLDSLAVEKQAKVINSLLTRRRIDTAKLLLDQLYEKPFHYESKIARVSIDACVAKYLRAKGDLGASKKKIMENFKWFENKGVDTSNSKNIRLFWWHHVNHIQLIRVLSKQNNYDSTVLMGEKTLELMEIVKSLYQGDAELTKLHDEWYRQNIIVVKLNVGIAYAQNGDFQQARTIWEEVAAFYAMNEDSIGGAVVHENLGLISKQMGDIYNPKIKLYRKR